MQLHDRQGKRLYLTAAERAAFMAAARKAAPEVRTLCAVLHDTGYRKASCWRSRPSAWTSPAAASCSAPSRSAGRASTGPFPSPRPPFDQLDLVHRVREAQRRGKGHADRPLWPWSRMTVWRRVREVMITAGIPDGPHRCPNGLRHSYGVHAIGCGVPLNMLCKWMGHASMEVTAIYANALGAEEQGIAARMWG